MTDNDILTDIVVSNYEDIVSLIKSLEETRNIIVVNNPSIFYDDIDEHFNEAIRRYIAMMLAKKTQISSDIIFEFVQEKFNDNKIMEML